MAAAFAVALVVRVAYSLAVHPQAPLLSDAGTYHLMADNLAKGHGFVRPYDLVFHDTVLPTAEFPPLFPLVLAAVSFAGGTSFAAHRIAMSVVGAITVVLAGLLGRRVAGPAVGAVAALVAAVHPMLFQSDAVPMSETLATCLATAALVAAAWARDPVRPSRRNLNVLARSGPGNVQISAGTGRWAIAGVLIGLCASTRTEGLLLLPLVAVPLAWRRWRELAVCAGVALAVLVPWTARNWATFHEFQPASHNTGTALAGANCALAYEGPAEGLWDFRCVTALENTRLDEAAQYRRYRSGGLRYARDHAGRLPRVVAVRVARTWGVFHRFRQQVFYESFEGRNLRWHTFATRVGWGVLALAAAGTAVVARRRQDRTGLRLVLAAPVLVTITSAATYGNQRFRELAEPSLAVLAAVALVGAGSRLRGPRPVPSQR